MDPIQNALAERRANARLGGPRHHWTPGQLQICERCGMRRRDTTPDAKRPAWAYQEAGSEDWRVVPRPPCRRAAQDAPERPQAVPAPAPPEEGMEDPELVQEGPEAPVALEPVQEAQEAAEPARWPLRALPPAERVPGPAAAYLATLASGPSRRSMTSAVAALASLCLGLPEGLEPDPEAVPWGQLRRPGVATLRSTLQERFKPATANRYLAALRGILREAWRAGSIPEAEFRHALDAARSVKGSTVPAGRDLDPGEVLALARACLTDTTPAGARDGALLALLVAGGLRRAEPIALDLADWDSESGRLLVRGKGRKERVVYLTNGAARALEDWVAVRGTEPGPLLCPVNKGGRVQIRRMTPQAVFKACVKRAAQAQVRAFTPHDLRRTLAGNLLDAGTDVVTVQGILGHASPATTARYDRRGNRAKAQAAARIHFPWR